MQMLAGLAGSVAEYIASAVFAGGAPLFSIYRGEMYLKSRRGINVTRVQLSGARRGLKRGWSGPRAVVWRQ